MNHQEILERINNRHVILDENILSKELKNFLTKNGIRWRQFRKGISDDEIMRLMRPDEVVVTGDRRFAYRLQERAILVPLAKSSYVQQQKLHELFGKRRRHPYSDISTCPICTQNENLFEYSWWDIDHMKRHSHNPYIQVSEKKT